MTCGSDMSRNAMRSMNRTVRLIVAATVDGRHGTWIYLPQGAILEVARQESILSEGLFAWGIRECVRCIGNERLFAGKDGRKRESRFGRHFGPLRGFRLSKGRPEERCGERGRGRGRCEQRATGEGHGEPRTRPEAKTATTGRGYVRGTVSSRTSIPLLVGIPLPCVSPPMRRLDKSP